MIEQALSLAELLSASRATIVLDGFHCRKRNSFCSSSIYCATIVISEHGTYTHETLMSPISGTPQSLRPIGFE